VPQLSWKEKRAGRKEGGHDDDIAFSERLVSTGARHGWFMVNRFRHRISEKSAPRARLLVAPLRIRTRRVSVDPNDTTAAAATTAAATTNPVPPLLKAFLNTRGLANRMAVYECTDGR